MPKDVLASSKRFRRKKILKRLLFVSVLLLFIFFGGFVGLFFINDLKVNLISVHGSSIFLKDRVEFEIKNILSSRFLLFVPQDRIFSFSEKKMEALLYVEFPELSGVSVKKDFPSTVIVEIKEREPVAVLCEENNRTCFYLDKTGFIFDQAAFFSSGVFLKFFNEREEQLQIGNFLLDQELFRRLLKFKERTDSLIKISEIYLKPEGIYKLQTFEGFYLILDGEDDWDIAFSNFDVFLKEITKEKNIKDIEYIDLRFNNKVFYK